MTNALARLAPRPGRAFPLAAAFWGAATGRRPGSFRTPPAREVALPPSSAGSDQRRHILAINNDASVLELFRDLLEDEGYRVSTQTYLDKNLAAIATTAPDLIILDYMWPGDDSGWSLLQMLRMDSRTASTPIVLCTGAVREVESLASHLVDMDIQVVLKPFDIDTLAGAIRGALVGEQKRDA